MYPNNKDYKYNEETAVEGEDYWYTTTHTGERVRQHKADGGGTITEYDGPCGNGYTDVNGES